MAVHMLRDGCSDSQRLSFLAEALTVGQFDHSHIVRLEGVVTRGRVVCSAAMWVETGWKVGCSYVPRPFLQPWEGAPELPSMVRKPQLFFH